MSDRRLVMGILALAADPEAAAAARPDPEPEVYDERVQALTLAFIAFDVAQPTGQTQH